MARPRSESRDALVSNAMRVFWKKGYAATSIGDLVAATGVGRGGIYADFGDKESLFLSCLETYRETFAEPALKCLASGDDGLSGIEAYFDFFIALHARHGMPGPGCFVANAMTERAPHDEAVFNLVHQHTVELRLGFRGALLRSVYDGATALAQEELDELAAFLATASQGLWSYGRSVHDVSELENFKSALMKLVRTRLQA